MYALACTHVYTHSLPPIHTHVHMPILPQHASVRTCMYTHMHVHEVQTKPKAKKQDSVVSVSAEWHVALFAFVYFCFCFFLRQGLLYVAGSSLELIFLLHVIPQC